MCTTSPASVSSARSAHACLGLLTTLLLWGTQIACDRAPSTPPAETSAGSSTTRAHSLLPGDYQPPQRVFLITVDTLRADHMSLYGYPRDTSPYLRELATSGVTFDKAIAQWPKTGASFASIFTGRYPQTTGMTHAAAVEVPEAYHTLPEVFHDAGYRTAAVISNAVLSKDLGWDAGFDEYLQTWGDGHSDQPTIFREQLWAGEVNERALPLLERLQDVDRTFVWLHYSDPHVPYILPDGFDNPFLDDSYYQGDERVDLRNTRGRRIGDHDELRFYVAQYDANILVTDLHIQAVLERARSLGLLDDALVIFTADHGESLGDHGSYFEHGPTPYNAASHVPLFFVRYGSAQDGAPAVGSLAEQRRVERAVDLVDLYPTLLDLALPRVEVDGLEGESLLPWLLPDLEPTRTEALSRYAFAEAGRKPAHYRSVQDEAWKLIYLPETQRRQRLVPEAYELYHLPSDPGETRNLLAEDETADHTEQVRRLRRELFGWLRDNVEAGSDADSEEAQKALRALGYTD